MIEAMTALSDEQLIEKAREGSGAAEREALISELFERYYRRVATWCYRFGGDREASLDLAQEVFLKAHRNLHSFRSQSKFSTWLYSIARNHCINHLKARSGEPAAGAQELVFDLPDLQALDVQASMERQDSLQMMRGMIREALDETETKVIVMHYADEIPLDAITRVLGLTNASGAKAYIVSAKRKLGTAAQRMRTRAENKRI
jgi:RNA polymerase sigma-70 factor, ECF subfamily